MAPNQIIGGAMPPPAPLSRPHATIQEVGPQADGSLEIYAYWFSRHTRP